MNRRTLSTRGGVVVLILVLSIGGGGCVFGLEAEKPGGTTADADSAGGDADTAGADAGDTADGDAGPRVQGWTVRGAVVPAGGRSGEGATMVEGRLVPGPAGPEMTSSEQSWRVEGRALRLRPAERESQ